MSDDGQRLGRSPTGTICARAPGLDGPYSKGDPIPEGARRDSHHMGRQSLASARARMVRNGVDAVRGCLGLSEEDAVARLAREMRASPARVLYWMEQGITRKGTWDRWSKAVDALTESVQGPRESRGEFGARLSRARRSVGLSQRKLSEAIGKSYNIVGRWERGEKCPGLVMQDKVLAAIERIKRRKAG